jgi:hypothetical protein
MLRFLVKTAILFELSFLLMVPPARAVSLDGLTDSEKQLRVSILNKVDPILAKKKENGIAPMFTYRQFYAPLNKKEKAFLDAIRAVDPDQIVGASRSLPPPAPNTEFVKLGKQVTLRDGKPIKLDAQYLPRDAYNAYQAMMNAMEKEIGKRLLVESGYRSPAYQLYLFLFYMAKHDFSIRETNRHVALPGCSEHGSPARQAIDFITPGGINGEDHPEEFEALEEYRWLQKRAKSFGFYLSYPRGGKSAFEPWHWHYEK